jgi:hypothetical protein
VIFDAKQDSGACRTRRVPDERGIQDVTEVQPAGGRGSESGQLRWRDAIDDPRGLDQFSRTFLTVASPAFAVAR